jgi:MOSC domain-containing protein YiiM
MQEGKLEAIWLKRERRGRMEAVERAALVRGSGIVGNANQGGQRQVAIIERRTWDRLMRELGARRLDPSARRANLLVDGVDLEETAGRVLCVGACRILIHGELVPCAGTDAAWPGLQEAMRARWGGGAFGAVLQGGEIQVGDPVAFAPAG